MESLLTSNRLMITTKRLGFDPHKSTISELFEIIAEVANGKYTVETLHSDILNSCDEPDEVLFSRASDQ